jgi:hypothetical protein
LFFSLTAALGCSLNRPSPLGSRRLDRVETAYSSLELALAEWALKGFGQDCLLLFNETEEWLIGCSGELGRSGFKSTGESWRGRAILWNPNSLQVSGKLLPYEQIKLGMVGTVGTHGDGTGEQNPVLIVQEWDALHKNHPAFQSSPVQEWLGIFVHEAFHARQMWHPRVRKIVKRWEEEKPPVTAKELSSFYDGNEAFRAALREEFELLKRATDDPDLSAASARKTLGLWLKLYRKRERSFRTAMDAAYPGRDSWFIDGFETFLEGAARYVEARFLMSQSALKRRPSQLPGLGKMGSEYFYALGMHLCFVLDAADPGWKNHAFDSDRFLIGLIENLAE